MIYSIHTTWNSYDFMFLDHLPQDSILAFLVIGVQIIKPGTGALFDWIDLLDRTT